MRTLIRTSFFRKFLIIRTPQIIIFIDISLCNKWKVICFVHKQYCFTYLNISAIRTPLLRDTSRRLHSFKCNFTRHVQTSTLFQVQFYETRPDVYTLFKHNFTSCTRSSNGVNPVTSQGLLQSSVYNRPLPLIPIQIKLIRVRVNNALIRIAIQVT